MVSFLFARVMSHVIIGGQVGQSSMLEYTTLTIR